MNADTRVRLERLFEGLHRLSQNQDSWAKQARVRLTRSTGLSHAGVELAIERCLETSPGETELEALVACVEPAPRAHVLLSSTVFVAAGRALALALAATEQVFVRASRREPEMLRIIDEAAPNLFRQVARLEPRASEPLFAFASDATLNALRETLPAGVVLHAHGPGTGLFVLHESALQQADATARLARLLAVDTVLFEQRGCLSPRLVLVEGERSAASRFARALASELELLEQRVPLGYLSPSERAEKTRYASTLAYSGELLRAGSGFVAVAPEDSAPELAPVGRHQHVLPVADARSSLSSLAAHVSTYCVVGPEAFTTRVVALLPRARRAQPGELQSPALDGPVDLRPPRRGEIVRASQRPKA